MRIGIITIHKSPNYGACLQCYGLYAYLTSKGFQCEVIDLLRPTHKEFVESKKYVPYRQAKRSFLSQFKKFITTKIHNETHQITISNVAKEKFELFFKELAYSKPFRCIDDLYLYPPVYDVYISGSDQLWNPTIGFCIEPYFLTFVNNGGKKISYATSIGISELLWNEKNDYKRWLSQYDAISVREKTACKTLMSFLDKEVVQVCDPSFLIDYDVWKKLAICPKYVAPYILLFTLEFSSVLLDYALRLKKESGKELIYLCLYNTQDNNSDYIVEKDAGPNEFLGYISNADMVITDSFHGTVFSLIMGANNFYTYLPSTQKRGQRITDLLTSCNLKDHILRDELTVSYNELEKATLKKAEIKKYIEVEKERSALFLLNNLAEKNERGV